MTKCQKFFRGFRFLKYKKFSQGGCFLFLDLGLKSAGFHFRKYNDFFSVFSLKSSISRNIRNFLQGEFFCFICLGLGLQSAAIHFRKYKKRLLFRKYKKTFSLRKYKIFFNITARKFHFPKYKEFFSRWIFLFFWGEGDFGLESAPGGP